MLITLFVYNREKLGKYVVTLLLAITPYHYLNYMVNGNPFYSDPTLVSQLKLLDFPKEVYRLGGVGESLIGFITRNIKWVVRRIAENVHLYTFILFGKNYLSISSLILFLTPIKKYFKTFAPLIIYSVFHFGLIVIKWSGVDIESRYMLPVYLTLFLMTMVSFGEVYKKKYKNIALVVFGIIAASFVFTNFQEALKLSREYPRFKIWGEYGESKLIVDWIEANTETDDILASKNPNNVIHRRPMSLLPCCLTDVELYEFLEMYEVRYLILEKVSEYRSYRSIKELLETEESVIVKFEPSSLHANLSD